LSRKQGTLKADFPVVLDACVLAEAAVSDLFLRLSEEPRLLLPRWTKEIWSETRRTWVEKLDWPEKIADSRIREAQNCFPDAMVTGYESLIETCLNQAKDKHVLAAAIHSKTETIVTFNIKDFESRVLDSFGIVAAHPSEYLKVLFDHDPAVVTAVIYDMAGKAKRSLPEMLARFAWYVGQFSEYVGSALAIEVPDIVPQQWRQ